MCFVQHPRPPQQHRSGRCVPPRFLACNQGTGGIFFRHRATTSEGSFFLPPFEKGGTEGGFSDRRRSHRSRLSDIHGMGGCAFIDNSIGREKNRRPPPGSGSGRGGGGHAPSDTPEPPDGDFRTRFLSLALEAYWPSKAEVEAALAAWAPAEAARHPGLVRLGSYARGDAKVGSDLDPRCHSSSQLDVTARHSSPRADSPAT